MPNLDGLQSTRLIREAGYSAPIVALSAYAEDTNVKVYLFTYLLGLPNTDHKPGMHRLRHERLHIEANPAAPSETSLEDVYPTYTGRK